jgi:anti-sigma-K factor RskA
VNGHLSAEQLELHLLGALEAEERAGLEAHLQSCGVCQQALAEARGRMAAVLLTAPERRAPAALRRRVLERLEAEPAARGRWQRRLLVAACVGLSLALGAALAIAWHLRQQRDELRLRLARLEPAARQAEAVVRLLTAPDTVRVELTAGRPVLQPHGRLLFHPQHGVLFYATHLPPPPPGRTYQLWLVPARGLPVSLGLCEPGPGGEAELLVPKAPAAEPSAFALTLEPAGGVPQPTGPRILVGAVR